MVERFWGVGGVRACVRLIVVLSKMCFHFQWKCAGHLADNGYLFGLFFNTSSPVRENAVVALTYLATTDPIGPPVGPI